MEDWSGAFSTKNLPASAIQEKPGSSSSAATKPAGTPSSRFSFNGIDKISFHVSRGQKPEWEVGLPPIEFYKVWDGGAWSGLSLSAKELHHFYIREQRRGPEPKYRAYSFGPEWEQVDFKNCASRETFLLERALKNKNTYRITKIRMLSSQELKREKAWQLELDAADQEILSLTTLSCTKIELEGWPKSFRVQLE